MATCFRTRSVYLTQPMKKIRRLTTISQVIEAIDEAHGRGYLRRILGVHKQSITNYKATKLFPSDAFEMMKEELDKISCAAPSSLWQQRKRAAA